MVAQLLKKLETQSALNFELQQRLKVLSKLVVSQQRTILSAMSDMVILKGATASEPNKKSLPNLRSSSRISKSRISRRDIADRRKQINDAAKEYEEPLARLTREVDTSKVTPAAIAAAIPESPEAWRQEHAQPSDESIADLVAGG